LLKTTSLQIISLQLRRSDLQTEPNVDLRLKLSTFSPGCWRWPDKLTRFLWRNWRHVWLPTRSRLGTGKQSFLYRRKDQFLLRLRSLNFFT